METNGPKTANRCKHNSYANGIGVDTPMDTGVDSNVFGVDTGLGSRNVRGKRGRIARLGQSVKLPFMSILL